MSVEVHYGTLYEKKFFKGIDESVLDSLITFHDMDERTRQAVQAYIGWSKTHSLEQIAHIAELQDVTELETLLDEADRMLKATLETDKLKAKDRLSRRENRRGRRARKVAEVALVSEMVPHTNAAVIPMIDPVVADMSAMESGKLEGGSVILCRDLSNEEKDKFTGTAKEKKEVAVEYCSKCLAREACRRAAIDFGNLASTGVYGGLYDRELAAYITKHKNT